MTQADHHIDDPWHTRRWHHRLPDRYALLFSNRSVIFSLEILNLYWDSLPVRGSSNFSLPINWKRIVRYHFHRDI